MRLLFFEVCEFVLKVFSQKFFRQNFFYGFLGLSRDTVPNIRLRYISLLPLVRHCIRIPADNSLLTKLIDATEPLATRDLDGDVITAMNHFYKQHGLLHIPNCCQFSKEESDLKGLRRATESLDSLTDTYLSECPVWQTMDNDVLDRQKEEQEQRLLFFQLDPSKKKMEEKKEQEKKHAASLKKSESVKKMLPKKMPLSNKMVQLDQDPLPTKQGKRKESAVIISGQSGEIGVRKQLDELKTFETETKKGTKIEPRSSASKPATKSVCPRNQSKSAGFSRVSK
jgi:hypothetical protein